jgi:hypothetical protein
MQYKCQPDIIGITAGSIDEESVNAALPKVSEHIFVEKGEKAGWYEIPDDKIPRFSRFPPRFQKKIEEVKNLSLCSKIRAPHSLVRNTSLLSPAPILSNVANIIPVEEGGVGTRIRIGGLGLHSESAPL